MDKNRVDMEEMEACSNEMKDMPVKGLVSIYEMIYMEHNQDNVKVYKLS